MYGVTVAVAWNCAGQGTLQNFSYVMAHAVVAQKMDGHFVPQI